MNELLEKLLASLKGTSAGARLITVLVAGALVAVAALAALVTNRPHYELAFSGLTDHELAEVCKALSSSGIAFEQSQPPGPFTVYVDREQRSQAYMAAYGAGALDKPLEGILSDAGMASVFNSAEERAQSVRKREWQEMERMLEELDFVAGASVRTSAVAPSSLFSGEAPSPTASVTLNVVGGAELTSAQATTVANLVSRGLGVKREELVISDQSGRSLYDGVSDTGEGREVKDLLEHQAEFDRRTAREANEVLSAILGPNKARVTVSSEWDFAQTTTSVETAEKGGVTQETKVMSEKPVGSSGSTTAGLSANTLDPDSPGAPESGSNAAAPLVEKTSEEKKSYAPSTKREQRVRIVPELKRLSVALFVDQAVQDAARLEEAVKTAVGFSEARNDAFSSVVLSFAVAPAPETPAAGTEAAKPPSAPNPLVETLLQRGVEIVSAVVFLVLLLKTLKGSKKEKAAAAAAATEAEAGNKVDPELLARAQIDELLKSDPAKVGEILARWAREEPVGSRG
jgi:flagellar M-ring protein FliF